MFQSDDFDDNLSDESFATVDKDILKTITQHNVLEKPSEIEESKICSILKKTECSNKTDFSSTPVNKIIHKHPSVERDENICKNDATPNRSKRKRKFPGPAGLLPDTSHETSHINLGNAIQSSQSYNCSQNQLSSSVFQEGPWLSMKQDVHASELCDTDISTIAFIKTQAGSYRLAGRRVPLLAGLIQSINHTLQDPSIVLRDETADIQCTLHRDAWELLKCYLVPQYTVMLLQNTTVLTTGVAVKKNYLNITSNNIIRIYCDESNAYTNVSNKILKTDTEFSLNGKYSIESHQIVGDKITILRNICIKIRQNHTSKGNFLPNDTTEAANNKSIAESLLEGINTDALFEDFD